MRTNVPEGSGAIDPEALLGELMAPLRIGDAIDGARWVAVSSELGLRLAFDDAGRALNVEVFPAEPARPHAARSERLLFAYRAPPDADAALRGRGQSLCRAVAERAKVNEARVLRELEDERTEGDARVREIRGGTLLARAGTGEEPYLTLSPYVGCLIGCRFCYAQDRVGVVRALFSRGTAPRWGSYVDARVDAAELLRAELSAQPILPIKFCPIVSDPYHAIEARLAITRACLEVLRDAPARTVLILTRAALIERDLDVMAAMPELHAGFSMPTIDDAVRAHFEPRAAGVPERLRVLAVMRARGLRTFAVVQPILPGSIDALADALAEHASSVSLDVLRGENDAAPLFDAHPEARGGAWQADRRAALAEALVARGVPVWPGELPPSRLR